MRSSLLPALIALILAPSSFAAVKRQNPPEYDGYNLTQYGDEDSTGYETANTRLGSANNSLPLEPDVFLNASVHVGEISLQVDDIRAKVNLEAQVLQLLKFNAGVDASIDQVRLLIQGVQAKVLLEARLENLVLMINDVLHSIDLNPIIATLGNNLNHLVNNTIGTLAGDGPNSQNANAPNAPIQPTTTTGNQIQGRSLKIEENILYSVNDYSGNNHMNRVLEKNGDIVDEFLDNSGRVYDRRISGNYADSMTPTGKELDVMHDGQVARQVNYKYAPFPGLEVVSAIYINEQKAVIGAQVVSEAAGGGSSTVDNSD